MLFYPSCGTRQLRNLLRLSYDRFVLVDKDHGVYRRIRDRFSSDQNASEDEASERFITCWRGKDLRVYRGDNRAALQALATAGEEITAFFGVCDGCQEGGNHECVHDRPFLELLFPLLAPRFDYFTDHSPILARSASWPHRRAHLSYLPETQILLSSDRAEMRLQGLLVEVEGKLLIRATPEGFAGPGPEAPEHPLNILRSFRRPNRHYRPPMLAWYRGAKPGAPREETPLAHPDLKPMAQQSLFEEGS